MLEDFIARSAQKKVFYNWQRFSIPRKAVEGFLSFEELQDVVFYRKICKKVFLKNCLSSHFKMIKPGLDALPQLFYWINIFHRSIIGKRSFTTNEYKGEILPNIFGWVSLQRLYRNRYFIVRRLFLVFPNFYGTS